jgi:hypothetical protein
VSISSKSNKFFLSYTTSYIAIELQILRFEWFTRACEEREPGDQSEIVIAGMGISREYLFGYNVVTRAMFFASRICFPVVA